MSAAAVEVVPATDEQACTVLIAALGGEGGGVLTDWIVQAATARDLPVQATSIPGLAQRTGATTYYIEIYPRTVTELGGRLPVMALYPSPGNIDVMVASEILEAGRAIENGFVSPDRTTLITSTHRVYSIAEKVGAAATGLYPSDNVRAAAEKLARRWLLDDLMALAEAAGSALNAVLLGAMAGSGALPIPGPAFADAVRSRGIAVDANLRGFEAGLAFARDGRTRPPAEERAPDLRPGGARVDGLLARVEAEFPAPARSVLAEGTRRTAEYQDLKYAGIYLDRLRAIAGRDAQAGGAERDFRLTRETARHLALWMTYEDIIRVADLKTRRERMAWLREEVGAKEEEPVRVSEFLKPGIEEVASVMPPWLGRSLAAWAERHGGARRWHLPMRVKSHGISGFLRLWILARLKRWRPRTYRFSQEQALIARWLEEVGRGAAVDYDLALEIVECATLNRGYGDTFARGRGNFLRILDAEVAPALAGDRPAGAASDAIRKAREAALSE